MTTQRSHLTSHFVAAIAALAFFAMPAGTQTTRSKRATDSLSREERAMLRFVDAHNDEGLTLLERVVNINSGTLNFAGVRAVGDVFRAQLDSLGFRTRWIDGAPFKRAGHLVAEHAGRGPRFLLIGHLDTVFEPDHPFQRFER
ncbi:MAG: M20 family peptidase, partial [Gemmatimonadaceae bacterium]